MKFLTIIVAACLLAACGPITPDIHTHDSASLSGNGAHSGIYAFKFGPEHSFADQLWYPGNRDMFNACAAKYGSKFVPAVGKDCVLGDNPTPHITQNYSLTGWVLESEYAKSGKIVDVIAPRGMWDADDTAIGNYIQLLKLRGDDATP